MRWIDAALSSFVIIIHQPSIATKRSDMPQAREKVLFQIGSIPGVPGTGEKKRLRHTKNNAYTHTRIRTLAGIRYVIQNKSADGLSGEQEESVYCCRSLSCPDVLLDINSWSRGLKTQKHTATDFLFFTGCCSYW